VAQRISVELVDDLDGTEATETVTFSIDGTRYEIDLSGAHAGQLRDLLTPYIVASRSAARGGARASSPTTRTRAAKKAPRRPSTAAASQDGDGQAAPARTTAKRTAAKRTATKRPAAKRLSATKRTAAAKRTKATTRVKARSTSTGRAKRTASTSRSEQVRQWAAANGHTVSARGRLSRAVQEAYAAAH
jgi:hypothetical protein